MSCSSLKRKGLSDQQIYLWYLSVFCLLQSLRRQKDNKVFGNNSRRRAGDTDQGSTPFYNNKRICKHSYLRKLSQAAWNMSHYATQKHLQSPNLLSAKI